MKKHGYKSRMENWTERWSKLGKAFGVQHPTHSHGEMKKNEEGKHAKDPLDKEFRESLAYFH